MTYRALAEEELRRPPLACEECGSAVPDTLEDRNLHDRFHARLLGVELPHLPTLEEARARAKASS
jgi:hypothetical protein